MNNLSDVMARNEGRMPGVTRQSKVAVSGLRLPRALWALAMTVLLTVPTFAARSIQTPEDKLLSRAFEAFMDGRDKTALDLFDEVVRINPNNKAGQKGLKKVKARLAKMDAKEKANQKMLARAKYKEAKNFQSSGDIVGAIDAYQEAMIAFPKYKAAEKELKKIKKRTEAGLDHNKFSPTQWAFSRGVLAYLDKDWSKAYRIWSQRLKIEPESVTLANAKVRAENRFKTLMISERELFYRQSARTLYEQGYYDRAKESWNSVLSLKPEDQEGFEGLARAEKEIARISGKGRNEKFDTLFERALDLYANQKWDQAKNAFTELSQLDPDFTASQEYIARINRNAGSTPYAPTVAQRNDMWREKKPSNSGLASVDLPEGSENLADRRVQMESKLKREPGNVRLQQELDKIVDEQNQESERVYKDGLIVYSQGNRSLAITKWKQVLIMNPEHKKAAAALRKARAEEDRSAPKSE